MKDFFISSMILCSLAIGNIPTAIGQVQEKQSAYGFSIRDNYGLVSFNLDNFVPTSVWGKNTKISAGTFAEGYYYAAEVDNNEQPTAIYAFDMKTGTATETISLADFPNIITDMTYDYTTSTLYAIADDYPETIFLKIDLTEKKIEKLTNLNKRFATLAADATGNLYLMASDGSIYRFDKTTYELTTLSDDFEYLTGLQSWDYDYKSGKFYWITTKASECRLVEISPETWSKRDIGTLSEAQISGLFTGYTEAGPTSPSLPTNLTATPATEGIAECTLSWTNPTTTFDRKTLSNIDYVTVYRNGTPITTIEEDELIGKQMSYTDKESGSGFITYAVSATNADGEGMFSSITTCVGSDLPKAPTNVVATAISETEIQITWEAPTASINNGWWDKEHLTYKVIRKNDGKIIAENTSETTITDKIDGSWAGYSYIVTAIVPAGEGESAVSNPIYMGKARELPIETTFSDENAINELGWEIQDIDGNGKAWVMANTINPSHPLGIEAYMDKQTDASDWLISAPVHMKANQASEISFETYTGYYATEKLEIYFGQSNKPEEMKLIKAIDIKGAYYKPIQTVIAMPITETDGIYHFAIRYATLQNTYNSYGVHINNLLWRAVNEGSISGVVTYEEQPMEGVKISIGQQTTLSDENGKYILENITAGDYTITANLIGYYPVEQNISIDIRETTTCNFTLTKLPTFTVNGNITDSNGAPITGAHIELSGYAPFQTDSKNATYSLENIYKGTYHVTVVKNNYTTINQEITVDENKQLNFTMQADNISPFFINAQFNREQNNTTIEWKRPVSTHEIFYDNGTPSNRYSYSECWEKTTLGSIYARPAIIREIKWMSVPTQGNDGKINIFIIELDENGNPNGKVLHQETDVPSTDNEWNTLRLQEEVIAPNGFLLAIGRKGGFGLAADNGENNKIKDFPHTQCFTVNYNEPTAYEYLDETSDPYTAYLLRAVCENIEPENATSPEIEYNVWRVKANKESIEDESTWMPVAQKLKECNTVDTDTKSGQYVYAVKANYPIDALTSEATFSDVVDINMYAAITINVDANSAKEHANGATVTISNAEREYTQTVIDNKAVFNDVRKDSYNITIKLNGFESISEDNVKFEGEEAEYAHNYTLTQKLDLAHNIQVFPTENPETWKLIWNVQPNLIDDFEGDDYEDFTINPAGKIGWQYIDNDYKLTYGFSGSTFPHMGEKMAAILFNYKEVNPPTRQTSHSGDHNLAFFANPTTEDDLGGVFVNQSDDYFISPRLNPYQDFKFTFWARTFMEETGYRERIRVGYSTTTPEIESFIWLDEDYFYVPLEYTKYEYDIPANAKYVVLNSHSINNFILLVDDVFIGVEGQVAGNEYAPVNVEKYEVYLDGQKITETTDNNYIFENVPAGKHTAAIVQVFATGKSPKLEFEFGEGGSNINTVQGEEINAYVINGILYIEGNYQHAELFNVAGMKIANITGSRTTDVMKLTEGIYILKVMTGNGIVSKKLVIK